MLFQVGDIVVHEVYGVGKVAAVEELAWKKPAATHYYVLMIGDAKIWVPVEDDQGGYLRPLTPKDDLPEYKQIFREEPAELDPSRYGRTSYLQESRKHPSFRALCETVRDLSSQNQKKKLAAHEAQFLQRVTRQLVEEWSLSAQISMDQAQAEINELLMDESLNLPPLAG